MARKAVVVTTAHRGVFFGYAEPSDGNTITLERARMCIFWPAMTHGVVGLANAGPGPGSRVSPAAPSMLLRNVTAVMGCTPEATAAWEREPWS